MVSLRYKYLYYKSRKKLHFLFDIYLHLIYMSIMENENKDIDVAI